MTDTAAPSLGRLALGDLDHEIANTRRVLERVPDEHLAWKPHARSFSLGDLAAHVANLLYWQIATLTRDEFDLAAPFDRPAMDSRAKMLEVFDAQAAELRRTVDATDDAALMKPWTLRHGDHVIFTMPKLAVMRGFGISHLVHHRGQLTVYLRLLDVPVPGLYGPSADEPS